MVLYNNFRAKVYHLKIYPQYWIISNLMVSFQVASFKSVLSENNSSSIIKASSVKEKVF